MDSTTTTPSRIRKRSLSDVYSDQLRMMNSDEDGDGGGDTLVARKRHGGSEMAKRKPQQQALRARILENDGVQTGEIFSFRVLLPNGTTLEMKIREPRCGMSFDQLVKAIETEYLAVKFRTESNRRQIDWKSRNMYILDPFDRKIKGLDFSKLNPKKSYLLRLNDGSGEAQTFENMWDLTPDVELLKELPEDYSLESALADLIDNSLQAVWSNHENERRLISVKLFKNKITIFDTGPGMDGSVENSISKWGRMGASLHRSSKGKAIGGKPPYLKPYFGMFGYGGPIASMHLGRRAIVSSKTKASKKVYILHLEREDLLSCSSSEKTWRTNGGLRDPLDCEIQESPHGSFTKVEIFEPKMRSGDIKKLQGKLKDIYFPYIQCDEISETGRTTMPTEFEVNETNLSEILDGEVATTNLFSCNGPDFTLQLHFTSNTSSVQGIGNQKANARLKCVYFPVTQGKESIERIIEQLKDEGYENLENFENFNRVSVRRLGRLLPDAHWRWLPFMETAKQRKGETLKRCCFRVKCFIDTDAGFNPTLAKTNLAPFNPFTIALKNIGDKAAADNDVHVEIYKGGKELSLSQLEKQYHEWISKMHERYDLEIESGDDQPILVLGCANRKELGTSSDVLRVHKSFKRKGITWKSGQRIKILKGACAGFHKTNTYATLEYIILEGCEGDTAGDARIICRPLGVPAEGGCHLSLDKGGANFDLRGSKPLPISVIDSKKCVLVDDADWECQLQKRHNETAPSAIELLDAKHSLDLDVSEMLPDDVVDAGHNPPEEILAIVRPASFNSAVASNKLDQKYILKENFEMILNIKFSASDGNDENASHVYSLRIKPSLHKGLIGVYVFPLRTRLPELFHKAGVYSFLFSLNKTTCASCEHKVRVQALSEAGSWGVSSESSTKYRTRVGVPIPCISIACYDRYMNRIRFKPIDDVVIKFQSESGDFAYDYAMDAYLTADKFTLNVKGLIIDTSELDKIGPNYETTMFLCSEDELFSVDLQVQVLPGPPHHIRVHPLNFGEKLFPGLVFEELKLEMFDDHNNHIQKDEEIQLKMDGFCAYDQGSLLCKVDANGFVNLGGVLKVTSGYGKKASLSVLYGGEAVLNQEFKVQTRELRIASEIPEECIAGSHLENIIFEVVNPEGEVDECINDDAENGQHHTLTMKSDSLKIDETIRYSFRHGRCTVRNIALPEDEGKFHFVAVHSRHTELQLCIEVNTKNAVELDYGNFQFHSPQKQILNEVEVENFQHQSVQKQILQEEEVEIFQHQSAQKQIIPYEHSSPYKVPKSEHVELDSGNFQSHGPEKQIINEEEVENSQHRQSAQKQIVPYENSSPYKVPKLEHDCPVDLKLLGDELFHYAQLRQQHEHNLRTLKAKQANTSLVIFNLEESIGVNSSQNCCTQALIMERINGRGDSAAAIACKLIETPPSEELHHEFSKEILGVVALLGFAETKDLSRILAEYLGEKQMLAVVCNAHASVSATKTHGKPGHLNSADALSALASNLGSSIDGGYDMICLNDIRPYAVEMSTDPQRKLTISKPTLPNGESPPGFLGYAVNMIHLSAKHLQYRTPSGHGLRETLFYRLLGELQVYTNRDCMSRASSYINNNAAVSLDGVIMRGNGVTSYVFRDPFIMFPVISNEQSVMIVNPNVLDLLKSKTIELKEVQDHIEIERMAYEEINKKFTSCCDAYFNYSKVSLQGL